MVLFVHFKFLILAEQGFVYSHFFVALFCLVFVSKLDKGHAICHNLSASARKKLLFWVQ